LRCDGHAPSLQQLAQLKDMPQLQSLHLECWASAQDEAVIAACAGLQLQRLKLMYATNMYHHGPHGDDPGTLPGDVVLQLSALQQLQQLEICGCGNVFSSPRLDVSPAQLAAVLQMLTALQVFAFSGFGSMAGDADDGEPVGSSSSRYGGCDGGGGSSSRNVDGVFALADVLVGLPQLSSFPLQLPLGLDGAAEQCLQGSLPSCWQQRMPAFVFAASAPFKVEFKEGQVTLDGFGTVFSARCTRCSQGLTDFATAVLQPRLSYVAAVGNCICSCAVAGIIMMRWQRATSEGKCRCCCQQTLW
jgi:hypothetical protein